VSTDAAAKDAARYRVRARRGMAIFDAALQAAMGTQMTSATYPSFSCR
jgi:hypothetical protein